MSSEAETQKSASSAEAAAGRAARERAKPAAEGQGIRLTEKAAERIQAVLKDQDHADTMYLYVGVKGGGCSGLQYVLDLRDERTAPVAETDEVFESQGMVIACDLKSYVVGNMSGTTIDYQETLAASGFTFHNPNAKQTCGCGASYSA
jgi:iron-sulfur cluster assembly protein